jgi:hypothetical protein
MKATKAFAASWLALCIAAKLFAVDESTLIVPVEAVGSADTRDESFLDACRQCITKVHGVRLAGRMTRVGGQFVKATADAKVDSGWLKKSMNAQATVGIQGVRDTTEVAFGGLITGVETVSETQKNSRWLVHIKANVMGRLPDKFAGKEAVVIPSVQQLAARLSGTEEMLDLSEVISQRLIQAAQDCFGLRKEYVILERESETTLDAELSRTLEGGNAARVETAKLQAEKVADSMLVFEVQPLRLREHQDSLRGLIIHHAAITPQATIKLVDLATRGVIATSVLRMEECSSQSETSRVDAMNRLRREVLGRIDGAISVAYSQLFWEFSPFTARIDDQGFMVPLDSVASQTLPSMHRIEILRPCHFREDDPIRIILELTEGKIRVAADVASLPKDQRILPYRILALLPPEKDSKNPELDKPSGPKPNNRSVVFSALTSLEASLSGGDPAMQSLAAKLAREIHQSVRSHFQGRKEYVILDRTNEAIAENELDRTVGANAAEFERNKLGKERAADLVLVFDFGAIAASAASQQFKFADSLNQVSISLSGNLKLIDVATKAEIALAELKVGPISATSVGGASTAAMQAEAKLLQSIGSSSAMAMSEVFWNLGQNLGRVTKNGFLEFKYPLRSALAKEIHMVRAAPVDESTQKRLTEGKDYVVRFKGAEMTLEDAEDLAGKNVLFKITALHAPEPNSASDSKSATEKASSILDKFK